MKKVSSPVLGIDLGTTNSVAAFFHEGEVIMVPNAIGTYLTPSVVAYDPESGRLEVGRVAKDLMALRGVPGIREFKRDMGRDIIYTIGPQKITPIEASALVLRSLKQDAQKLLGREVDRCVISVPAYFNEAQRRATMAAGELAGFTVERIINEPTAAAIDYGLDKKKEQLTFLVFDLGGGTFDVCVMEYFYGALEVKSVAGVSRLGGEDFTRALARKVLEHQGLSLDVLEIQAPEAYQGFLRKADQLKRLLDAEQKAIIPVPVFPGLSNPGGVVEITQKDLAEIYRPLMDQFSRPVHSALTNAGLKTGDIQEVILVGGGTRMPAIRELAEKLTGHKIQTGADPDLSVARGAAVQAGLLDQSEDLEDLVVTDILSHSLGYEVSHELGGEVRDGYFEPLIHRNTVIPCTKKTVVSPFFPSQTQVKIRIFEGESRYSGENHFLGEILLKNLPKPPLFQGISLVYSYDPSGLLEVEAQVLATGERKNIQIERISDIRPEEKIRILKIFEELKKDPREREDVKALLLKASLLYQDSPPGIRERLNTFMLRLEDSLAAGVSASIDQSMAVLENYCIQLDTAEDW